MCFWKITFSGFYSIALINSSELLRVTEMNMIPMIFQTENSRIFQDLLFVQGHFWGLEAQNNTDTEQFKTTLISIGTIND